VSERGFNGFQILIELFLQSRRAGLRQCRDQKLNLVSRTEIRQQPIVRNSRTLIVRTRRTTLDLFLVGVQETLEHRGRAMIGRVFHLSRRGFACSVVDR
jgi:hypothetical protein